MTRSDSRAIAIELADFGVVQFCAEPPSLSFRRPSGEVVRFADHALLSEPGELRSAVIAGRALVGRSAAGAVHLFDAQAATFRVLPIGERFPRVEQLQILGCDDLFLVLTENGVLAIDTDGEEHWRIAQVTYDWTYVGHDTSTLSLSDAHGNLLDFDIRTGRESGG